TRTKLKLAHARQSEMAAAIAALNTFARGCHRSGRNAVVESESRRSERAASAAPSKATQSVRCWTKMVEPGMPLTPRRREAMAISGKRDITERARTEAQSSMALQHS